MKNLINQLNIIQKSLKAPKSQYNAFGKYKYRNCEDILEAVKPLLPEGYSLFLTDDMVLVGDRFYLKATVKFTDGTNTVENTAFARESLNKKGMDESQITGTASSYARKYALNGLLLIDDTKDADSDDNRPKPVKQEEDTSARAIVRNAQEASQSLTDMTDNQRAVLIESNDPEELLKVMGSDEKLIWADCQYEDRETPKKIGFVFNKYLLHFDKAGKVKTYYSKKEEKEVESKGKWVRFIKIDEIKPANFLDRDKIKYKPIKLD